MKLDSLASKTGLGARGMVLAAACLAAGAALRFWDLGRASYQIDELITVADAWQQPSAKAIIDLELQRFNWRHHLPMIPVIVNTGHKLFAHTALWLANGFPAEWAARLPFALFGFATLPLFFWTGTLLRSPRVGLWALVLGSFSIFHVFYSREVYDYAVVIFFAAGLTASSLQMVRNAAANGRLGVRDAVLYALFLAGLLQSHLCGLLLAGPLTLILAAWRVRLPGEHPPHDWRNWMLTLGVPWIPFLPFLLGLIEGGFHDAEWYIVERFSWNMPRVLLGAMGWGWSWPAFLAFVGTLAAGFWAVRERAQNDAPFRVAVQLAGIGFAAYLAAQLWSIHKARFETRYFSIIFPALTGLAACGLDAAASWIAGWKMPVLPRFSHAFLAAAVLGASLPSLYWVLRLEARGWMYRKPAEWINANLPEGGLYVFRDSHQLRGIPGTYLTPGRFASHAPPWNSPETFEQNRILPWLADFFERNPFAAYIEVVPEQILVPHLAKIGNFDTARHFNRHIVLSDPAWQRLYELQTHPVGPVGKGLARFSDHVFIWYNQREDLPAVAARLGKTFYSFFESGWSHGKDPRLNDWWFTGEEARVIVGSLATNQTCAEIRLQAVAAPAPGSVSAHGPDGNAIGQPVQLGTAPQAAVFGPAVFPPGESPVTFRFSPSVPGQSARLLVHRVDLVPSAP